MDYIDLVANLRPLGPKICDLLIDLLHQDGITFHSIDYRIKDQESALNKISSKSYQYAELVDLKDLLGIRVITYFADDVDKIAEIVEQEFAVDYDQSVDKRALLASNAFGYASRNWIGPVVDLSVRPVMVVR